MLKALLLATGLAALCGVAGAAAQDRFPAKPIRLVVPFGPGGATDVAARWIAEKAKVALGQNIVVDNKPGANGIIAIEEVAHAKPDGHTLLIGSVTTNGIAPVLYASKMSINYERDMVAVARLMVAPNVLITTAKDFGPKTFRELVDYAKKNPGKVRYGTNGIGSFMHYDTELLARKAGISLMHIPYKGAGDIMKGVLSGEVQVTYLSTPITMPQARAGTVHVIANVLRRLPQFPDIPTLAEFGVPDVGTGNWQAIFAPAGTPPEVLKTLHKVLTDAAKDPAVVEAASKTGAEIWTTDSVEETQAWLRSELAKWRRITQDVKIDMN